MKDFGQISQADFSTECRYHQLRVADYMAGYRDVERFLGFCRACRQFDTSWACPSYDFDIDHVLSRYEWASLMAVVIRPSAALLAESREPEAGIAAGRALIAAVRPPFDAYLLREEAGHSPATAFFAGSCYACGDVACTRSDGHPCRHPEAMRHSLESFGFDIGRTAEELFQTPLKWSADGAMPDYFVLVGGLLSEAVIAFNRSDDFLLRN